MNLQPKSNKLYPQVAKIGKFFAANILVVVGFLLTKTAKKDGGTNRGTKGKENSRVAVALVAGVHAGNRGLSAAAGINAALAQVVVAHIEMPRAAAYGRLDAAAEAQVALYSGNQGRRVANVGKKR
ncbi:hypothetical protein DAPPUDRAFT_253628 [Daphnia pulex]|uniref:Uncharacterized protein n=1 Tax=Daphnia pulex TaxID=6669 RepID=E9H586_DAPPU|nr:hypothetical protein DAPPUDRAFT_253628 [Daphnia pulex]|eukprot:EFX73119.1 hypothetical protein DAPPUDRAFT_253628 [Daphnia pulex]